MFQQQRQAFIQTALAVFGRGHAVEAHQRMQAQTRQCVAPFGFALLRVADEIQYWQQRFAATGQHTEFVAVLGQHRFAGINHVQPRIRGQQLAQHFGFLLKALAGLAAFKKTRDAGRAVQAFAGAVEALKVVEQRNGIFQPRCVVQLQ